MGTIGLLTGYKMGTNKETPENTGVLSGLNILKYDAK